MAPFFKSLYPLKQKNRSRLINLKYRVPLKRRSLYWFRPDEKMISQEPPSGAPEGTVWFGGPVDRWKVALRVYGEELDPDRISAVLGCQPSSAQRKGDPFPKKGRWLLEIDSKDYNGNADVDHGIRMLLGRLPTDSATWVSLTSTYAVDIFCSIFLPSSNRGFGISTEVSRSLSDRNLEIGFDVYIELPNQTAV